MGINYYLYNEDTKTAFCVNTCGLCHPRGERISLYKLTTYLHPETLRSVSQWIDSCTGPILVTDENEDPAPWEEEDGWENKTKEGWVVYSTHPSKCLGETLFPVSPGESQLHPLWGYCGLWLEYNTEGELEGTTLSGFNIGGKTPTIDGYLRLVYTGEYFEVRGIMEAFHNQEEDWDTFFRKENS